MYENCVNSGALLLDRVRPGWAGEIAADRLAMATCDRCVLGQLYGGYWSGFLEVVRPLPSSDLHAASDHGFTLADAEQDLDWLGEEVVMARFAALADAWRAEIRRRRGEGRGEG